MSSVIIGEEPQVVQASATLDGGNVWDIALCQDLQRSQWSPGMQMELGRYCP